MGRVLRVPVNTAGRDFIVGDVHGHFGKLSAHLTAIGFNADAGDRLFSVGDLVDRGPESESAEEWLDFPWFFAVAGNHEQMAIDWADGLLDDWMYRANGGVWNIYSTMQDRVRRGDVFRALPVAIELETAAGLVGIVHANVAGDSWLAFVEALDGPEWERFVAVAQWDRSRLELAVTGARRLVEGVRAVVVGHTPLDAPVVVGNVHHIDTGGWLPEGSGFTVLDAATLQPVGRGG